MKNEYIEVNFVLYLQSLLTKLIIEQPADPLTYMIGLLEQESEGQNLLSSLKTTIGLSLDTKICVAPTDFFFDLKLMTKQLAINDVKSI